MKDISAKIAAKDIKGRGLIKIDPQFVGDIYRRDVWSDLQEFTVPAAGFTLANGYINVSANQANSLLLLWNTALINHSLSYTYRATNGLTNALGLRIGFKSINDTAPNSCDFWFNEATRKIGYFKSFGAETTEGTQVLPSYTPGDLLRLTINSSTAGFTAVVDNLTTGQSIVRTEASGPSKNTSNIAITAQNTPVEYTVSSLSYSCPTSTGGTYVVGDSIDVGSAALTVAARYATLIGAKIAAGSGDKTREVVLRLSEIVRLNPAQVVLKIGTNDTDLSSFKANYIKIVNTLTQAGINVIKLTPPPSSNRDMTAYVDWIKTTYPASHIDIFTPMKAVAGTGYNPIYDSGDGVHPNNAGHAIIASTILNSSIFTEKEDYRETSEDFAGKLNPTGVNPGDYGPSYMSVGADGRIKSIWQLFRFDRLLNRIFTDITLQSSASIRASSFYGLADAVITSQGTNFVSILTNSFSKLIARFFHSGGIGFGEPNDPGAGNYKFNGTVIAKKTITTELLVYADNAAAASSGLVAVNEQYRTPTGVVMVRF